MHTVVSEAGCLQRFLVAVWAPFAEKQRNIQKEGEKREKEREIKRQSKKTEIESEATYIEERERERETES